MGGCLSSQRGERSLKGLKLNIGSYKIILQQKIAVGAYGQVWRCRDSQNSQKYALKQIKIQSKQLREMYERQSQCLKQLNDNKIGGVIELRGCEILKKSENEAQRGLILTDFYETNLLSKLKQKQLQPSSIIQILKSLLRTLKQIHSQGIIHLDLKLQNILSDLDNYFICDFGSSIKIPQKSYKQMNGKQRSQQRQFFQANSTFMYRAPQMIDIGTQLITPKIDIWMLGCIVKHPFEGAGQLAIVTAQIDYQANYNPPSDQKQLKCKDLIVECLKKMLVPKVDDRYNEEQLLELLDKL